MYNRDNFTLQHITVTDGDYLILWLDDLDLPPPLAQPDAPLEANCLMASCSEYVRVYEVDADQRSHDMAILCGNIDQFDSLSRSLISVYGKDVYIDMNFDSETPEASRFIGRGYRILYTAGYHECKNETFIDVEETGLVASSQFPHNTCTNSNSFRWSDKKLYHLEMAALYFDGGQTCQQPRASYREAHYRSGLCGGRVMDFQQTTFRKSFYLLRSLAANFLLKYRKPRAYVSRGVYIDVIKPDYDVIEQGSTCVWKIQSPQGTSAYINSKMFQEYEPSSDYCTYHGLYLIDGSGSLIQYTCPSTNYFTSISTVEAPSNVMYIRLVNASRETNLDFRFYAHYAFPDNSEVENFTEPSVELECNETTTESPIQTRTTSSATNSTAFNLIITSISPDIGILAGGTRLTLTGQNFIPSFILMFYGDYVTTSSMPCSNTTCFVRTSPGKAADAGIKLPISLTSHCQERINTSFTFTYQPNPQVNSIYPLKTLVVGGTTLTVQGEGFRAVNEAQLMVHVLHTIRGQLNDTRNVTTFTSLCEVHDSDTLKCPTPNLTIPDQFKHTAEEKSAPGDDRNKRSTADYTWNIDGQSSGFLPRYQIRW